MKKWVYGLLVIFLFTGCNLFSGLDKEDLDGNSFDYKVEESMASGDYGTVLNLIESKIAGTVELKAIDDVLEGYEPNDWTTATETALQNYYDAVAAYYASHTGANVSYYIQLKLLEAEANLGLAGLKMTTIISQITNATKTTKAYGDGEIDLGELVPNGLNSTYLSNAVRAYVMGLPTDVMLDEYKLRYLNGALTSAISAVNRAIQLFAVDPDADEIKFKPWTTIASSDELVQWNANVAKTKTELIVAKELLILFGTSSDIIDEEDVNEIETKVNTLISKVEFIDATGYAEFTSAAGMTIEP